MPLVFRRQPYMDADRIIRIEHRVERDERLGRVRSAALYEAWRTRRDILAAAGAYLTKTPAYHFSTLTERARFMERLVEALATVPGVEAVTTSAAPPSMGDSPMFTHLEIDGRPVEARRSGWAGTMSMPAISP